MQAVLGAELRDRQLAPDRLECYFRFEFSIITPACRLGHLYSSFQKDQPSLSHCPIRGGPLFQPMKKIAMTMRSHRELLLNYFRAKRRLSSGVVEGLNNKAKLTMRKSYGFRTFRITEIALYHALG